MEINKNCNHYQIKTRLVVNLKKLIWHIQQNKYSDIMVEKETVQCGRCDKWFEREKEKNARIKKEGKVKEYLCPDCDDTIIKDE
jgi:hypothetical protein